MKIVIQRVQSASVAIEDSTVGTIKQGLLLLVGVGPEDTKEDLDYAVRKIINMRIFSDEDGKMNLSVKDIGGQILSISQFTLFADTKKAVPVWVLLFGGKRGIRTLGAFIGHTRFPVVRLRPAQPSFHR